MIASVVFTVVGLVWLTFEVSSEMIGTTILAALLTLFGLVALLSSLLARLEIQGDIVHRYDAFWRHRSISVDSTVSLVPYGNPALGIVTLKRDDEKRQIVLNSKRPPFQRLAELVESRGGDVAVFCPKTMFSWPSEVGELVGAEKRRMLLRELNTQGPTLGIILVAFPAVWLILPARHSDWMFPLIYPIMFAAFRWAQGIPEVGLVIDRDGVWSINGFGHRVRTLPFRHLVSMGLIKHPQTGSESQFLQFKEGTIYILLSVLGARPVARKVEALIAARVSAAEKLASMTSGP